MPRFSVKDLLIATTLIAVGACIIRLLFVLPRYQEGTIGEPLLIEPLVIYAFACAVIGAGIGIPLKRPRRWAIIGTLAAIPVLFIGSGIYYLMGGR